MEKNRRFPSWAIIMGVILIGLALPVADLLTSTITIPSSGTLRYGSVSALHTSGIYIYDSSGKRVNLYGPMVHNGGGDQHVLLSDIQTIKTLGFNSFRLGIYWGLIQPYNETVQGIDVTYFTNAKEPMGQSLDQVVNWAIQEKMYITLCLGWTTTWTPPTWAFPGVSDFGQRYASLINGTASRERMGVVNTWQYIANRYRSIPNVLFEFLNEPEIPTSQNNLAGKPYKDFSEEIVTAIEFVETFSHLKIVEFLLDSSSWVEILPNSTSDISKPNVLWASHTYVPMNGWVPSNDAWIDEPLIWNGQYFAAGWHNQTVLVAWRLIRMADKVHQFDKPWINTEFGKQCNQDDWDLWFDLVLKISRDYNITGWTIFTYCPNVGAEWGYNIKNPETRSLIMGKLTPYMVQPP